MAQKKNAVKTAQKKNAAPKAAPKAPAKAPETSNVETQEIEQPATVATTTPASKVEVVLGKTQGQLDANRRMDMLTNMRVMFHEDPRARQNLGDEIVDAIDDITRAGLVVALADYSVNNDDAFAAILKSSEYPALVVAANKMNIKLPALKALPSGEEEGTVVLDTSQVEVPEDVAKTLQEEKKEEVAGDKGDIELDPVKIAKTGSDEDVKKALHYLMIKKPKTTKCGVGETLVTVRDFIHSYRKQLAEMAENKKEAIASVIGRSTYEELNDAFSFVKPTFLFSKIGVGLDDLIRIEKCPLSAFITVRHLLTDKEGNIAWTDEDIASATRAIVKLYEDDEIAKSEEAIAQLDPKKDKKIIDAKKDYISDCNKVIEMLTSFDYDICDESKMSGEDNSATYKKAMGRVRHSYYPEFKFTNQYGLTLHHEGLSNNVAQKAGIILNLFCSPGTENAAYSEANLIEVVHDPNENKTPADLAKEAEENKEESPKK